MQKYVSDQRFAVRSKPFLGTFRDEVLTVESCPGADLHPADSLLCVQISLLSAVLICDRLAVC